MYGSYSRHLIRQSQEAARAREISERREKSESIARFVKTRERVTQETLVREFGAEAVEYAIELDRTIHPVVVETRQGLVTFYAAN